MVYLTTKTKGVVLLLLVVGLPALLALRVSLAYRHLSCLKVGDAIANFELRAAEDAPFNFYEGAEGDRLLLFFSYRCASCRRELEKLRGIALRDTALSISTSLHIVCIDNERRWRTTTQTSAYPFPIYHENSGMFKRVLSYVPCVVLIDGKNIVKGVYYGTAPHALDLSSWLYNAGQRKGEITHDGKE